jgi:hypothetical protein
MEEKGIFPSDEGSRDKKRRRKNVESSTTSRLSSDQASESSGGRSVVISVVENRSREVCVCKMDFAAVSAFLPILLVLFIACCDCVEFCDHGSYFFRFSFI